MTTKPSALRLRSKVIWTDPLNRFPGPQPAQITDLLSLDTVLIQLTRTGMCFAVRVDELEPDDR